LESKKAAIVDRSLITVYELRAATAFCGLAVF